MLPTRYLWVSCMCSCCMIFFFQAEDGIRDKLVTGVQTCALPILRIAVVEELRSRRRPHAATAQLFARARLARRSAIGVAGGEERSEERRVGKEWRSRWSP